MSFLRSYFTVFSIKVTKLFKKYYVLYVLKMLHLKSHHLSIHKCNTCNNTTDFARIEIPYAYKLLSQELQTINICARILTE